MLLDKVTELVQFSYSLQSDSPPLAVEGMWLQFRDKGMITVDMFQDERFSTHYIPHLFTSADLIKLFEHLLIIAPLSSTEYFMPSLLHMISPEEAGKLLPRPSSFCYIISLCCTSAGLLPSWMCPEWSLLCSSSLSSF